MFKNCSSIKYLDLSKLCTDNAIDMSSMLAYCNSIEKFYIRFHTFNVKKMSCLFNNCTSLKELKV